LESEDIYRCLKGGAKGGIGQAFLKNTIKSAY
jgi:hypothetical protein